MYWKETKTTNLKLHWKLSNIQKSCVQNLLHWSQTVHSEFFHEWHGMEENLKKSLYIALKNHGGKIFTILE